MSDAAPGPDRRQLVRTVRRSAPWFVAALAFWLISIPALFDLRGLLVGLAVVTAGLGAATAAFTWFDRD